MSRLKGKVAIISNAARPQGASQARLFAAEGAHVVVSDPDQLAGEELTGAIVAEGGRAVFSRLDVDSEGDWGLAVAAANQLGGLDILVNNAYTTTSRRIDATEKSEWEQAVNAGARGSFFGVKAVLPPMLEKGQGSIVNVASVAAMAPPHGISEAHASMSGALRILSKDVSADYAAEGIRCNTVHAGLIGSELAGTGEELSPERVAEFLAVTPMRRAGTVDEVAHGVLFLASDDASYITGTELVIDGGYVGF